MVRGGGLILGDMLREVWHPSYPDPENARRRMQTLGSCRIENVQGHRLNHHCHVADVAWTGIHNSTSLPTALCVWSPCIELREELQTMQWS